MNTLSELKEAAANKNYEIHTADRKNGAQAIGLTTGKGVFHWFEDTFATGSYYFSHSYSQNNGTTKKGLMHQMRIRMRLGLI